MDAIEVVAAVIEKDGKLLITRRREGTHLSGLWEFPGGKPEPGEALEDALRRELREELGAAVSVLERIETVDWQYPDRRVSLVFFRCGMEGEPRPLEGQEMAWVTRAELARYEFPAADARLIERLSRS
jgi:8-oxo-dGTP diphosphatase